MFGYTISLGSNNKLLERREKRIKGLNTDQITTLKLSFVESINIQTAISHKYRLRPEAFQTLVLVWLHPCSTAFFINSKQLNTHRSLQARLVLLKSKGLIEVIGKGKQSCNLYCVSPLFLEELSKLV